MNYLRLLGWCVLFAVSSPLWLVGAVLAFLHGRVVNPICTGVIRWGMWEPCQAIWRRTLWAFKVAYRPTPEVVASEAFKRRVRRAKRGG